ncbi:bis(5'-nucleosyl)-tetraphosphatase (symmetrical) YqeK [Bacillaceae bacterium Marseille-Q3522]|nr:bis(5'-nucleosyl)-tetraphosphatase (symmetrical) YqeK [Bacillaceae bacterium Marseille-Q3522]
MKREDALLLVKDQLTEARYKHTIGVMETAVLLADRFGENEKKAELAAIFHDYAKYRPKEELAKIIKEQRLGDELLTYNSELWHAPAGAYLVEKEAGIHDEAVLSAIRYHTSGRPQMTILEQIIYLADYIEPGRQFPGVEEVRTLAKSDLQQAMLAAITNSIIYLLKKQVPVFPATFKTYNDMVKRKA